MNQSPLTWATGLLFVRSVNMKLYTNNKSQRADVTPCWRCIASRWLIGALIVVVVVVWALQGFV
jgi:hypothetical protein